MDNPPVSIKSSAGLLFSPEAVMSSRQPSLEVRVQRVASAFPGLSGESCESALIPVAKAHGTSDLSPEPLLLSPILIIVQAQRLRDSSGN